MLANKSFIDFLSIINLSSESFAIITSPKGKFSTKTLICLNEGINNTKFFICSINSFSLLSIFIYIFLV